MSGRGIAGLGAGLAIVMVLAAGAWADPDRTDRRVVIPEGPFRLQCWQGGVRIVEETGLSTMTLGDRTLGDRRIAAGVTFRRVGGDRDSVFLAPGRDTTCLIREEG